MRHPTFRWPRGMIRRHMDQTRKHRTPTSATPPVARAPLARLEERDIEAGRQELDEILRRAR